MATTKQVAEQVKKSSGSSLRPFDRLSFSKSLAVVSNGCFVRKEARMNWRVSVGGLKVAPSLQANVQLRKRDQ